LDSRKLIWLAPNEIFHIARLNSSLWLDIAVDGSRVRQWLDDYDDPSMTDMIGRNCIVSVNDSLALLLGSVREIFQRARAPESLDFYPSASIFAVDSVLALITADRSAEFVTKVAGRRPHILETTLSLIDSCEGALLDTDAICTFAHTTERTIRNVFNDYFRLSPHRYMMLRRLHSIRRTIRDPGCSDNITSICARHCVWDFGRFAGQYRGCFGLLPSEDLANARRGRMGIVRSPSRYPENSMGLPAESRIDGTTLRVGRVVVTF
jgi:AraC family ethanolamine operon transcriptional activator